ncbi:MAG TPA: hypothetical protein VJZ00_07435 [Thermoanaerobaculia bacterium]|nr:hypothetical protein [Thermoanaerobaculia bacterium]
MRFSIVVAIVAAFAACRGEPVPRDYQNAPPAMTHPAAKKTDTPSAHGMGQAPPQPSSGVEGTATPPEPSSATLTDTPPATTGTTVPTTTT